MRKTRFLRFSFWLSLITFPLTTGGLSLISTIVYFHQLAKKFKVCKCCLLQFFFQSGCQTKNHTTVVEDDTVSKEIYNEIDLPHHCSWFFSHIIKVFLFTYTYIVFSFSKFPVACSHQHQSNICFQLLLREVYALYEMSYSHLIFIDFGFLTFIDSEEYMGRCIDIRFEDIALKNEWVSHDHVSPGNLPLLYYFVIFHLL